MMDNRVTIITRINASELYIPISLLRSRGIECEVKNGIANQVTPMYTIGDGGAKLLVDRKDYEIAYSVLKEGGFISREPIEEPSFIDSFDRFTSKNPFLNWSSLPLRLAIFVVITIMVLVGTIFLSIIYSA